MNHTEVLTRYTANFVDELNVNGITDVVISPGSRSTPLALTMAEHKGIKEWIIIDERSAAFFALGIAKQTKRPVALVCTSGTAAANYFPAIVEAHYSRVPLVVLTADRPHELRDVGAPQAIEQIKLYGDYVKWFQEMAIPEATPEMLRFSRSKAARSVYMAQEGNSGPVHVNFPFREPLSPDFSLENMWGEASEQSYMPAFDGKKRLDSEQLIQLIEKLKSKQKGIIVCGPQTDADFAEAVTSLASHWGLPILADPLSQVRSGQHHKDNVIEGYDAILRNEAVREKMKPDFIIRFGAMPVSKPYLFYVKEHMAVLQFVVENHTGYREPVGNTTEFIFADSVMLCKDLIETEPVLNFEKDWLDEWKRMNLISKKHLLGGSEENITEGEAVRALMEVIPDSSGLYVGNSMAVRDVDTFFMTTPKNISILANRGANGIDGMVSSGLGAASSGEPMTLLLGDLSFFHDMNGLLAAKHYNLNITILIVNNNGGGIFSFLPQAKDGRHFEALFGTPADVDFKHAVMMYGGEYAHAATEDELKEVLDKSYQHKGLSVVEVKTDRTANADWHRKKWKQIENEILNSGD
ncbi:2-succinyl-5-enolpyruvyl-6-hydroxy-3-cyclohexene-1-carboxylic-acid synthase [Virgibacillus profundi]|uniref:2-succinyl-5-enolpyruvyl-6-hydroxy-3-cyclohexene-1-carboxylate synthase n=1 Tax=Virgibacillus profundi TaxID=2024555 RepID=A0A2A2I825_9BACI|nr:2-succinyl-5-enolpyruvyl-6-hydroxy-3-cyclohexene-1-carboxylic-acid synthase [Virgibacillus profundi]PAV27732.1 2-succinyl-5-enolpyruvyl-6-hydroxy-3-cyclohexene-1-carboxylic-acid synthase [Virgibacillus profundi]PXY51887.1 2-succinyl-5-enolpyruvyl-6-hydroxy-3-cyclohexene-1-carboxylic-acid synthase [Virgibacillus profundi]